MNLPSPRFNLWPVSGDQGDVNGESQLLGGHRMLLGGHLALLPLRAGRPPQRLQLRLLERRARVEGPQALDCILRCGVRLRVIFGDAS